MKYRWTRHAVAIVLAAMVALPVVTSSSVSQAATTGGPVFLDGTDNGYHGSAFFDPQTQIRSIQSGWSYYATWYQHLLALVPGSYANDGTIAVLGTTGFDNDVDNDFQHDDPSRSFNDCGVGTFEVARSTGLTLRWFDGAVAISAFLDAVEAGSEKPALIHIVEHTRTALIGTPSALCKFGLDDSEDAALADKSSALAVHVNRGGALFGNDHPYTWLTKLEPGFQRTQCAGNAGSFTAAGVAHFSIAAPQDAQSPHHNCLELSSPATNLESVIEDALLSAVIGGSRVTFLQQSSSPTPVETTPVAPPSGGSSGGGGGGGSTGRSCVGLCLTWGEDRYQTALAAFEEYWSSGSSSRAVIAVGENFPDAIVGGPLASRSGAPVLLARSTQVSEEIVQVMRDRGITSVTVVGGESVISRAVESRLKVNFDVVRLWSEDRYQMSSQVAAQWAMLSNSTVYLAPGDDFAAQLVAGHLAARAGSPLLLVRPNGSIPPSVEAQIRRLRPSRQVVVSRSTVDTSALDELLVGDSIQTIVEPDVYDLSLAGLASMNMMVSEKALIVTGEKFPDALSGIAVARRRALPLLLNPAECVPTRSRSYLDRLGVSGIEILGGPQAIFEGIEELQPSC